VSIETNDKVDIKINNQMLLQLTFINSGHKFRASLRASILLQDDIKHITIASGYEILGHVELNLGQFDEAKLHFLAVQEICKRHLHMLVDQSEEVSGIRDSLEESIQRIRQNHDLVEFKKGEENSDCAGFVDVTIIDSIFTCVRSCESKFSLSKTRKREFGSSLINSYQITVMPMWLLQNPARISSNIPHGQI
jgi:hypothetical protein